MNIIHRIDCEQSDIENTVQMETSTDGEHLTLDITSSRRVNSCYIVMHKQELDEYIEHLQKCRKAMD